MSYLNINSSIAYLTNETYNSSELKNSTSRLGPQRDSLNLVIPITIIYSTIFVVGLFGNIITCAVIIRNKSMHTATNHYLFSLAISDLLLLVIGLPQEMYLIWSKWPYIFGPVICVLRGLAAETCTNASLLTIIFFTVERYLAICHPFKCLQMSKLLRAKILILILWVLSLVLALFQALEFDVTNEYGVKLCLPTKKILEHSYMISAIILFALPIMLISVLYYLIFKRLNRPYVDDDGRDFSNRTLIRERKGVNKMLIAVVVAFFFCWAPFHFQRLVAKYGAEIINENKASVKFYQKLNTFMTYLSGIFYYVSTCINPILYNFMSNKFREAFQSTIQQFCCRNVERSLPQNCSYTTVPISRQGTRFDGSQRERFRSSR